MFPKSLSLQFRCQIRKKVCHQHPPSSPAWSVKFCNEAGMLVSDSHARFLFLDALAIRFRVLWVDRLFCPLGPREAPGMPDLLGAPDI